MALLWLMAVPAAAQVGSAALPAATRSPLMLGAYAQGSILVAHTYAIRQLVASHPTGFEINLQRQTTGAAPWHGWYQYPKVGLALTYCDFHNPGWATWSRPVPTSISRFRAVPTTISASAWARAWRTSPTRTTATPTAKTTSPARF
ncbi:hypothetical protein ACFQT0_00560 [Hymenobacter humi]|uniref:Uncharacterized protein n=1 Tax=Hymenobacter humi TaxID=1411620 RepID=A0ABW2TXZ0_9BACT